MLACTATAVRCVRPQDSEGWPKASVWPTMNARQPAPAAPAASAPLTPAGAACEPLRRLLALPRSMACTLGPCQPSLCRLQSSRRSPRLTGALCAPTACCHTQKLHGMLEFNCLDSSSSSTAATGTRPAARCLPPPARTTMQRQHPLPPAPAPARASMAAQEQPEWIFGFGSLISNPGFEHSDTLQVGAAEPAVASTALPLQPADAIAVAHVPPWCLTSSLVPACHSHATSGAGGGCFTRAAPTTAGCPRRRAAPSHWSRARAVSW